MANISPAVPNFSSSPPFWPAAEHWLLLLAMTRGEKSRQNCIPLPPKTQLYLPVFVLCPRFPPRNCFLKIFFPGTSNDRSFRGGRRTGISRSHRLLLSPEIHPPPPAKHFPPSYQIISLDQGGEEEAVRWKTTSLTTVAREDYQIKNRNKTQKINVF